VTHPFARFYILSLLFVGLLVRSDDPRLLGSGAAYENAAASPFVIASVDAGLVGFDSFMNVVILISVISIGNSGVYGGSRTLTALAEQGYAPRIFTYIDRAGRPLFSTIAVIAFGCLAYINLAAAGPVIFEWLLALSGLAALFTWGSICVAHIRFRSAWAYNGHTKAELPFQAIFGVIGSWIGAILVALVLIAQFYTAVTSSEGGVGDAEGFFKSYLAMPIVLLFWAVGYIWKREGWLKLSQIDVYSGRREIHWESHRAEQERKKNSSFFKRIYYFMF
jgi:yeast amino acid transporter